MIPTYTVEEHHEAFIIWHRAREKGRLNHEPHSLVHVDNHADMDPPQLRHHPLKENLSMEDVISMTRSELDIQSFITPAIYLGMFNRVLWLRPQCKFHQRQLAVWSKDGQRKTLHMSHRPPRDRDGNDALFQWASVKDPIAQPENYVLDIDLDYFAMAQRRSEVGIEISEKEYQSFLSNPRHFFRIEYGSRARVERMGEQTKLYFTPLDAPNFNDSVDNSLNTVNERIELFSQWLSTLKQTPKLITICRSISSGWSDQNCTEHVEREVLKLLKQHYQVESSIHIDEIYPPQLSAT
jgi:hypothetical protein